MAPFRIPLILASLAAFAAAFVAVPAASALPDRDSGRFSACGSAHRHTCVVDGDTFWYRGSKVRIADINTPEVSSPGCAREAALGAAATRRLIVLLNSGPFTLRIAYPDRRADRYGRSLVVVTRNGQSLGMILVSEGLAERWKGRRSSWCR